MNPTSQFHPYTPETSVPQTGNTNLGGTGLSGVLSKLGIDQSKIGALGGSLNNSLKNIDLQKARGMARNNGGLVLGGLAALVIGAGLLRRRSTR